MYEDDPAFRAFINKQQAAGRLSRSDFVAAALIDMRWKREEQTDSEWARLKELNWMLVGRYLRENAGGRGETN